MRVTVHLPIEQTTKLLVHTGDSITTKTILMEKESRDREETIPVSKLLHISPDTISQYLKKKLGDTISAGDLLMQKKSLFSSHVLRSPFSGKLMQIDLKKGSLVILTKSEKEKGKVLSPIRGKVTGITKTYLEVEITGQILKAVKGGGNDVSAVVRYFPPSQLEVLDVDSDVDNCIVACHSISDAALTKIEVLDSEGLILEKISHEPSIPYCQVTGEVGKELVKLDHKHVWLRPGIKQIVVFEGEE